MLTKKLLIGELLVSDGLITPAQLQAALTAQQADGGKLCATLVAQGALDWNTLHHWLANRRGFACIDLSHYAVNRALLQLVPGDFARKHDMFPLDQMGKQLTVGMAVPLDTAAIESLEQMVGLRVKAVLCSMDGIRAAIARYYPSPEASAPGAPAPEPRVAELARQVERLPALPDSVRRIGELLGNPEVEMNEVAGEIRRDPAITAQLLSLANSPAFGLNHPVKSVELAVAMLGLRETYGIVMGFSVKELLAYAPGFDHVWFWNYANFCANCATVLSKARGVQKTGEAYTAGLLHDIGRLVLAHVAGPRYSKVDQNLDAYALIAAEVSAVGESHPEAGYLYAQHLGLPRDICEVIRYHHDLDYAEETQPLIATVQITNVLYRVCRGEHCLEEAQAQCAPLLGMLGLNAGIIRVVADVMRNLSQG